MADWSRAKKDTPALDARPLRDRLLREAHALAREVEAAGGDPSRCRPDGAGMRDDVDRLQRRCSALESRIAGIEARVEEAVRLCEQARARRLDAEVRADLANRRLRAVAVLVGRS